MLCSPSPRGLRSTIRLNSKTARCDISYWRHFSAVCLIARNKKSGAASNGQFLDGGVVAWLRGDYACPCLVRCLSNLNSFFLPCPRPSQVDTVWGMGTGKERVLVWVKRAHKPSRDGIERGAKQITMREVGGR